MGVQVSLLMQSIHLGGVLENFNKSMHNIHNLSCITLRLVLLVCWLGVFSFFCVKLQEVVIILIFNIARRGRSFIIIGSLLALLEFRSNSYFNKLTSC